MSETIRKHAELGFLDPRMHELVELINDAIATQSAGESTGEPEVQEFRKEFIALMLLMRNVDKLEWNVIVSLELKLRTQLIKLVAKYAAQHQMKEIDGLRLSNVNEDAYLTMDRNFSVQKRPKRKLVTITQLIEFIRS